MVYCNKIDWIIKFIKEKKVLDLGCVQHNLAKAKDPDWLHGILVSHAKSVLGVDYLQNEVSALKLQGYNIVCANVEKMELGDDFEVIVAGDLIEHLSNFGQFMERISEHLGEGGIFLVTTPNPVNILRFVQVLFSGRAGANPEHTCWFTEKVLDQLAARYGFNILDVAYVDDSYQYYNKKKWWPGLALNYILCRIRPQFCETLCIALRK